MFVLGMRDLFGLVALYFLRFQHFGDNNSIFLSLLLFLHGILSFSLYSLVSPTIERLLGPSRVEWKQNVTFHCKSYGVPIPRITWLKDMRNIPYTTRIYAGDSVLNITSVGHNDTGNYTCEASNVVGSARMTRELIVEGERVYKVLGKTGKGCYRT